MLAVAGSGAAATEAVDAVEFIALGFEG